MSFIDCVNRAVEGLELDEASSGRAIKYYQNMLKKHQATGELGAEKLAAAEAVEQVASEAKKNAMNKFLSFKATKSIYEQVRDHKTAGSGKAKPYEAGIAVFDNNGIGGLPGLDQIHAEYRKRAYSMLDTLMAKQKKNILSNSSDPQGLFNVVDEIFGKDSGDMSARQMAKSWNEVSEWLRLEFNRAGGNIRKLDDWGLPQVHDAKRIRNINKGTWEIYTWERLDIAKMAERHNMTPDEIRDSLGGVYDNIVSEGTNKINFDSMGFSKATSNSKMDPRFLIFKGPDEWFDYQNIYGNSDPFATMMDHINVMTRDIALMKRLGPNPVNGLEVLKQTVRKFATELKDDNNYESVFQDLFDTFTGAASIPVNARMGKYGANLRQGLTAAQLGSAVVSAVTDPFFIAMTSNFNGLGVHKVMGRIAKTANSNTHQEMLRLGLTADSWADTASALARYQEDTFSSSFFQKLSSGVIRLSGLQYWTDMMRWSFEREFLGFISENAKHSLDKAPKEFQNALKRYAISPEEWDIIRSTPQYDLGGGALYLRTQDIAKRSDLSRIQADELSLKMANMIDNETNFAVPTASLKARRKLGKLGDAGTVWGEVTRSGLMYKSFPLFLMMTHMRRGLDELQQGRMGYVSTFLIGTTVVGALATQLKEMKDGKQPSQMFDENWAPDVKFWTRALLQGGGLGIFGDFILRDHNRYGGGPQETAAGPGIGAVHDAFRIGQTLLWDDLIDDDYSKNLAKAGGLASNLVPGRSLWWLAAPYKRGFQDNLRQMGDKRQGRRFKRMLKSRKEKENSGYWWGPGEVTPF